VQSREPALSSVIVKTNKLLSSRGSEIVILKLKGDFLLGRTIAVQPFAEFSRRDYGRPARDSKSGMLPPKLARMMINLAQIKPEEVILDPFCGSGTILQESLILSYKNIIGSDISKRAIENAKKNLTWLLRPKQDSQPALINTDVRCLSRRFKPKSINAIITEPYLGPPTIASEAWGAGPPFKRREPASKIKRIIRELELLYLDSFKQFKKVLKPRARIVIIFPVISCQKLEILKNIFTLGFLQDQKFINLYNNARRQSFLYSRAGQRVKREIFIFNYCKPYEQSKK
jgi:tRNA G10  N-methylase Trm11